MKDPYIAALAFGEKDRRGKFLVWLHAWLRKVEDENKLSYRVEVHRGWAKWFVEIAYEGGSLDEAKTAYNQVVEHWSWYFEPRPVDPEENDDVNAESKLFWKSNSAA